MLTRKKNQDHTVAIVWFRQDLRISDNPALLYAAGTNSAILPIYILDDHNSGQWKMGAASRWWLHESLCSLGKSLEGKLCYAKGDASSVIEQLVEAYPVTGVYWNRCYEPWRIKRDSAIKEMLENTGIECKSFNGSLLLEPHQLLKSDQTPYKVFTPFYKQGYSGDNLTARIPEDAPSELKLYQCDLLAPEDLGLLPDRCWYKDMQHLWSPGEPGAKKRLHTFVTQALKGYKEGRDLPSRDNVSRLSPHLHFGELSVNQVWHHAEHYMLQQQCAEDGEHFLRELVWREFSYNLLYHNPLMPSRNMRDQFDQFPWREDPGDLERWQKGQTGYPIVDAGMRELWKTGYMHNRVRMITASFLVKNLLVHWKYGARWFWDTLLDADLANNSASWQWIAGSGADAAPYFRIFNPVLQGQKFDPEGHYVRSYVPEISHLPNRFIHRPWEASEEVLTSSGVTLGETYPRPLVDLKLSRERALQAYAGISGAQSS